MKHEEIMSNAIALSAAFIANGDIRLGRTTSVDPTSMAMTRDLIENLYHEIQRLDAVLSPGVSH